MSNQFSALQRLSELSDPLSKRNAHLKLSVYLAHFKQTRHIFILQTFVNTDRSVSDTPTHNHPSIPPTLHLHIHECRQYLLPNRERRHALQLIENGLDGLVEGAVAHRNHAKRVEIPHLQFLHIATTVRAEDEVFQVGEIRELHLGESLHAPVADGDAGDVGKTLPGEGLELGEGRVAEGERNEAGEVWGEGGGERVLAS